MAANLVRLGHGLRDPKLAPVLDQVIGLLQDVEDEEPEEEHENPIMHIAGKVAANLVRLGRGLRDAAEDMLVNIGFQIHALL
jgi:hypothetical protein